MAMKRTFNCTSCGKQLTELEDQLCQGCEIAANKEKLANSMIPLKHGAVAGALYGMEGGET